MSDVSKTNELIEQLRAFGKADFMGESGAPGFRLLWDASDALESATRVPEQGEGKLADVISEHDPYIDQTGCYDGGCQCMKWNGPEEVHALHRAREVAEWLRGEGE